MLIYIHGFRSGPQSEKSMLLRQHMEKLGLAKEFWGGQLVWNPTAALQQLIHVVDSSSDPIALVGSSLGGHFATWLAEHYAERRDIRVVLVNPCVLSRITLESFLGVHKQIYTEEEFELTQAHLDDLATQKMDHITHPERYWLLAEKEDEVLDYRDAVAFYAGARQTVLEGGNHSFTRWPDYQDDILRFAGYLP